MEDRMMAKIQLKVELENADSRERFDLECPFESDSIEVSSAIEEIAKATDINSIILAVQNAINPESELYKHLLEVFAWKGHDKEGWHDVRVFIRSIDIDEYELPIDADEVSDNDLSDALTLQLVRRDFCGSCGASNELSMYFLDTK
jgi:hypothetical protein